MSRKKLYGFSVILLTGLFAWLLSLIPGKIAILAPVGHNPQPTPVVSTITPINTPSLLRTVPLTHNSPTPSPTASVFLPDQWKLISLPSAFPSVAITTLTGDPNAPNKLFAGTFGAGIYISQNSGQTWTASNQGLGKGTVGTIVVNPQDPKVIYAALLEQGGVYRSIDGGQSWQAAMNGINLDIGWQHTGMLTLAQSDPEILLFTDTTGGVYRSWNGGRSWSLRSSGCPLATGIVLDSSNADHLIVPSFGDNIPDCPSGIYESFDGARTWKQLTTNEMTPKSFGAWWQLAAKPSDMMTLYASSQIGTYKTLDSGLSWERINDGCDWIAVSPFSESVFCKHEEQLWVSRDQGRTWDESGITARWSGQGSVPIVFQTGSPVIYVAGSEILQSLDDGRSWQGLGPLGAARMHLSIDPTNTKRLFLTMIDKPTQILRSENEGETWQVILKNIDPGGNLMIDSQGHLFYPNPGGPNSGLYRSEDSGDTWEKVNLDNLGSNLTGVIVDPINSEHLWGAGGCGSGLVDSYDGGQTFQATSEKTSDLCQPILLSDPSGKWMYIIQWGNFFRSKDGGETWEELSSPKGIFLSAALDPFHPEMIYIGSTHNGLLKSINGGETWQEIDLGHTHLAINDIAIDTSDPQKVYIASDQGVFFSEDGGSLWQKIINGLEENPMIYSLELDPKNSSKIYAITPNGIYFIAVDTPRS